MVLARNKLNIVETLLSSALNDLDISHEEFAKIIGKKVKYEGIKENIKNVKHEDLDKENDQTTSLENVDRQKSQNSEHKNQNSEHRTELCKINFTNVFFSIF